ncbi:MAG: hypothetical protein QMC17_04740 [Paracoccaceae bacterium]|jgi:epoxyqueuosine reductase
MIKPAFWYHIAAQLLYPIGLICPVAAQHRASAAQSSLARPPAPLAPFLSSGYDVEGCKAYLNTSEGQSCLSNGCAVRGACPVTHAYARMTGHSAYHMGIFNR